MILNLFQNTAETQKDIINKAMYKTPPKAIGVYTMYDAQDRVLYVGKAKNLYNRITSYRYSKTKKVQQMIAHISKIGFEVCKTETDAYLLENLLIRSLRPPYNKINKKTETYYYIASNRSGNKREYRIAMQPLNDYSRVYGCFKGHKRVRKGLGALLRFLYIINHPIKNTYQLPVQLLNKITPQQFRVKQSGTMGVKVHQLLEGTSDQFLEECNQVIESYKFGDRFTSNYFNMELENLRFFYELGPKRNNDMKVRLNLDYDIIPQDKLDDLNVLYMKELDRNTL